MKRNIVSTLVVALLDLLLIGGVVLYIAGIFKN